MVTKLHSTACAQRVPARARVLNVCAKASQEPRVRHVGCARGGRCASEGSLRICAIQTRAATMRTHASSASVVTRDARTLGMAAPQAAVSYAAPVHGTCRALVAAMVGRRAGVSAAMVSSSHRHASGPEANPFDDCGRVTPRPRCPLSRCGTSRVPHLRLPACASRVTTRLHPACA